MLISIFHTPLWQLWGFMIAMVALQPQFSLGQANSTSPADVTALVDFMAGLSSIGDTQMVSWDVYTDPCTGVGWPGVICHCSGLPSVVQPGCSDDTGGISRIRGIDLHLMSSSMQRIEGTISPALGDLTQLVYLDLSQNHLRCARHHCCQVMQNITLQIQHIAGRVFHCCLSSVDHWCRPYSVYC